MTRLVGDADSYVFLRSAMVWDGDAVWSVGVIERTVGLLMALAGVILGVRGETDGGTGDQQRSEKGKCT